MRYVIMLSVQKQKVTCYVCFIWCLPYNNSGIIIPQVSVVYIPWISRSNNKSCVMHIISTLPCKAVPEIRFFKCPDKMSEQAQNCSDISLTLTEIIVFVVDQGRTTAKMVRCPTLNSGSAKD